MISGEISRAASVSERTPTRIKIRINGTVLSGKRRRTAEVSEQPSLANTVAGNDDLLTEILFRLPIRSLLRFKLVSKRWLSLITDPHFTRRRNPYPNPPSGLFLHRSSLLHNPEHEYVSLDGPQNPTQSNAPFKTLTFASDPSGIRILQSCNGLLLCCSFRAHEPKRSYYIYNPTTKQYTTLPQPRGGYWRTVNGVNLAFDPSKSPNYKVVCVRRSELGSENYQIELYSSDAGPWRDSGEPFVAHADAQFNGGVYWNGSIHWICGGGDSLYFNVDEERLGTMPMPDGWEERRISYFGEGGGHLHLVETYRHGTLQLNVYEMKRDYSKWVVKYHIDLEAVPAVYPEMIRGYVDPPELNYYAFSLLLLVRGDKDDDSYLVLEIPGKAIRFNIVDNTFKKLCDFSPSRPDVEVSDIEGSLKFFGQFCAFPYIESLSYV